MSTLDILLAEHAIREVLYKYSRGVDRRDPELLKSCYHDDAVDDHGTYNGDAKGFIDYIVPSLTRRFAATSHSISNVIIDLKDSAAHVESYCTAAHLITEPRDKACLFLVGSRYIDLFEERDTGWKIAYRVVIMDWSTRIPISETALSAEEQWATQFVRGATGKKDLCYPAEFARRLTDQGGQNAASS